MSGPSQADVVTCRHGDECGACALLGRAAPAQLASKRELVVRALARERALGDVETLATLPSPRARGYRNRAKMAVSLRRDGGWRLGYFRRASREVVDAPDCEVLQPELLSTTRRLRNFLEQTRSFPRELRFADVRCGSDPTSQHLVLVLRRDTLPRLPTEALLKALPLVRGISVNLNPGTGPTVIKGPIRHLVGEREVRVSVGGLALRVSPGSFFQVNLALLEPIHELMGNFLGEGGHLLDLYGGVGTHGFALRERFGAVTMVEGVRGAVADAKATARENEVERFDVVAAPVERSLRRLRDLDFDAAVLNPSRAGARRQVLDWLARSAVRRVAYLSCEPATLARDLTALVEGGFHVRSVQPIDMMPQTGAVEALALLDRD